MARGSKWLSLVASGVCGFAALTIPAQAREWTDSTGKHKQLADLVDFDDRTAILKKADGRLVGGTLGNDTVRVVRQGNNGDVRVRVNGVDYGRFAANSFTAIAIFGQAGNDNLDVATLSPNRPRYTAALATIASKAAVAMTFYGAGMETTC